MLSAEPLSFDPDAPVLTPADAKGLEFDVVIVVEPERILAAGPSGAADLYVTLTRATQRLGIVHTAAHRNSLTQSNKRA